MKTLVQETFENEFNEAHYKNLIPTSFGPYNSELYG